MEKKLILILIVAVLGFGATCKYYMGKSKDAVKLANTLENTISDIEEKAAISEITLCDSVKLYKAKVEDLQITQKNLEALYGDLLQATNLKAKDVDGLAQLSTLTSGSDSTMVVEDSLGGLRTAYLDPYTHIIVNIDKDKNKAIMDYQFKDSLTIINYTKRHSILFGLIRWQSHEGTEVISHNPKSTPVAVTATHTIQKK